MGYYFALAQIGAEMAFPALLGYWIDDLLGTMPWFTAIAAVTGFVGGLVHLILILKEKERADAANAKKKPPP
jgi:F0F1-type ATP synthase assembly protein I